MESKERRQKKWNDLWRTDVYKNFHLTDRNPELWKFLHLLCTDPNDKSGMFLVPMCGKCLDLKFLYEEGFNVLGVELLDDIVQEFFRENDISYEVSQLNEDFKLYSTTDGRLKVACGDLLSLNKDVLGGGQVKMIWDRGALGSIEKELKKSYATVMKNLLRGSKVKYLLDCWQYRDWYKSKAPHNICREMIEDLYGDELQIEELQRKENKAKGESMGAPTAFKMTYLLSTKV